MQKFFRSTIVFFLSFLLFDYYFLLLISLAIETIYHEKVIGYYFTTVIVFVTFCI